MNVTMDRTPDNPEGRRPSPLDWLHGEIAGLLGRLDHRYTRGRRRLVAVVARSGRPVSLPEILEADSGITQSSAYRNLEVLERSGAIRRITIGGDHARFELAEPFLAHHHHLVCVGCGTIEDVELDAELERLLDNALTTTAADNQFTPLQHSLDLHGRCAACSPGPA
jgi:Fur family ferric uptake transcriptional regulator